MIDVWQCLKCSSEILTNFCCSFKSRHPEEFYKEGVHKNFTNFTGKHLFQTRFNKVAGLRPATLLKTCFWSRCFPMIFVNFLTTALLRNTSVWLKNSRPEVFCKKDVLRNFPKFTGKHLCQGLFFNKVTGLGLLGSFLNFMKTSGRSSWNMAELREIFRSNLFIIINSLRPATLSKKVSGTDVFQSILRNF